MKATSGSELYVKQRNEVGVGAELFSVLGKLDLNVIGFSGWVMGPEAFFRIVLDSVAEEKAVKALVDAGYDVEREGVILVELPNSAGALADVLQRLALADIDVEYAYGTNEKHPDTMVVVKAADNKAALAEIIVE
ncbi:MAG: hypothetical protein ACTSX7_11320 [Alphaproteobacteria bacterium]